MSFTDTQIRKLRARVRTQFIKERELDGKTLHYLEGWHLISEANRIFGFDGWDRETMTTNCVSERQAGDRYTAAYLTRVRISVHVDMRIIVREGLGSGEATAPTSGQAHERASKAAETDATKRALSTFGNSFGLSLYKGVADVPGAALKRARQLDNVQRGETTTSPDPQSDLPLLPQQPLSAASKTLKALMLGSALLPKAAPGRTLPQASEANESAAAPKYGANPAKPEVYAQEVVNLPVYLPPDYKPVDKSLLALSEPKRRRNPLHLKFVARQPCLVCGRTPSQAHHVRISQPRALGRKVSDEFTVPLCAVHHHELHRRGNEGEWWQAQNINPMPIAEELWKQSVK